MPVEAGESQVTASVSGQIELGSESDAPDQLSIRAWFHARGEDHCAAGPVLQAEQLAGKQPRGNGGKADFRQHDHDGLVGRVFASPNWTTRLTASSTPPVSNSSSQAPVGAAASTGRPVASSARSSTRPCDHAGKQASTRCLTGTSRARRDSTL